MSGPGEVDWERTIESMPATFSGRSVMYLNDITRASSSNTAHLVARFHRQAVDEAARSFGGLLGYPRLVLDHEAVEPLPSSVSIAQLRTSLLKELQEAFTDRRVRLLKALLAWLGCMRSATGSRRLALYGTSSFHVLWEEACSSMFRNEFAEWESELPRPRWISKSGDEQSAQTLRPDILRRIGPDGGEALLIADAKYYSLQMPPNLGGNPGVGDVAKQLFYERVLGEAATRRGLVGALNCFVFPTASQQLLTYAGTVNLSGLGVGPVVVTMLSAMAALKGYVSGGSIPDSALLAALAAGD